MLKIKSSKLTIILIFMLFITSACTPQHDRIIDQLSIFIGIGIDIDEDDPDIYILTTSNPVFSDEADVPVFDTTVKGFGLEGALQNWEYQRQNRYAFGKVSTIIFGHELLKNGIGNIALELRQFADMNVLARAVYYPGKPQDALVISPPEEPRRALFLMNMLDRLRDEGLVPDITLCGVNTIALSDDMDVYLPQIELTHDKSRFHVTGLALLDQGGKLATVLSDSEMLLFLILQNDAIGAFTTTNVTVQGKEGNISFLIKAHGRTKVEVGMSNDKPEISVTVPLEVEIRAVRIEGIEGLSREFFNEIEREILRDLSAKTTELLEKMQKHKTDPLGLGQWVRIQQTGYHNKGTWRDDYPDINITSKVDVRVSRINIIQEKPQQ